MEIIIIILNNKVMFYLLNTDSIWLIGVLVHRPFDWFRTFNYWYLVNNLQIGEPGITQGDQLSEKMKIHNCLASHQTPALNISNCDEPYKLTPFTDLATLNSGPALCAFN